MKHAFRSALIVSLLTLAGHGVLFLTQMIIAAYFGATSEMDAYLAASTLPSYLVTIIMGSLGYVFIPVFVEHRSRGTEGRAYDLALSLLNWCSLILGMATLLGIVFARELIHLSAPGLSSKTMDLAVQVAIVTWPTILASGPLYLLSSIYQAEKKFTWQAAVPLLGAFVTLGLLILFGQKLGVLGVAVATTLGVVIQVFLLTRILTSKVRLRFSLDWKNQDLRNLLHLAFPLILVTVITKATPLVDRYLASGFHSGSISHLNYAFKIVTVIAALVSIGLSTVIFPRMAQDVAQNNLPALRSTLSHGLRLMWILIAPIISIGFSLALPIVILLFKRGAFNESDVQVVTGLLRIYVFGIFGMALGNVTSKGFYVLKDTKTLAVVGVVEAMAYGVYTTLMTKYLGIQGIAMGCLVYFTVAVVWQVVVLNLKTGGLRGRGVEASYLKTAFAALGAGVVSYSIALSSLNNIPKLLLGVSLGIVCYMIVLKIVGSEELSLIWNLLYNVFNAKAENSVQTK